MEIPLYLAQTGAEFAACTQYPAHLAWMACHFSPYGTGLTNLPKQLPPHSLLILNDRTPVCGHDPELIGNTLAACCQQLGCAGILLDFQRPGCDQLHRIIDKLLSLSCPVAVSDIYARDLPCPVFLSAPPLHKPIGTHLAPWQGREIWLEAALSGTVITVTEEGSSFTALPHCSPDTFPFQDSVLHCHYRTECLDGHIRFTLSRSREDLNALLAEAAGLGVTRAVGLYQELSKLQ